MQRTVLQHMLLMVRNWRHRGLTRAWQTGNQKGQSQMKRRRERQKIKGTVGVV
jgi:hypothetical protein